MISMLKERLKTAKFICRLRGDDPELERRRKVGRAATKSREDTQEWIIGESQQLWAKDWLSDVMNDEAAAEELNGALESVLRLNGKGDDGESS